MTDDPNEPRLARKRAGIWPTFFTPLPIVESERALEIAGTNGFAIYAALHKLRFLAPLNHRDAFFCSEEQIARHCGLSARRLRQPLRELERVGLVGIARPVGIDRINHEAAKISLRPVVTNGNLIATRPDDLSGPDRTIRPVETGQKRARICPTLESPPKGETHTRPLADCLGGSPRGRDESEKSIPDVQCSTERIKIEGICERPTTTRIIFEWEVSGTYTGTIYYNGTQIGAKIGDALEAVIEQKPNGKLFCITYKIVAPR